MGKLITVIADSAQSHLQTHSSIRYSQHGFTEGLMVYKQVFLGFKAVDDDHDYDIVSILLRCLLGIYTTDYFNKVEEHGVEEIY